MVSWNYDLIFQKYLKLRIQVNSNTHLIVSFINTLHADSLTYAAWYASS